jgi:hypothetical protein
MTTPPRSSILTNVSYWRGTLETPGFALDGRQAEFDGWSGGTGSSDGSSVTQGTSDSQTQVLGGPVNYSDLTIHRAFDYAFDWDFYLWLEGQQGRLQVIFHRQPLDVHKDPFGKSQTGLWTMKEVSAPDGDMNSGTAGDLTLILGNGGWSQ